MKRITKFNIVDKKEGRIVNKIQTNGSTITGQQMNDAITKHYFQTHQDPYSVKSTTTFPFLREIQDYQIQGIQRIISKGKAVSWDCISDKSLKGCGSCKEDSALSCKECDNISARIRELFSPEF